MVGWGGGRWALQKTCHQKGASVLFYLWPTTHHFNFTQLDKLMKPDQLETDKQEKCEQRQASKCVPSRNKIQSQPRISSSLMKQHLRSHLPIKSHYFLAPTASGDSPPPLRPMFLPCRVASLTRHTFLLSVKPGWRLNVWVAAMRQRGEGGEEEEEI